MVDTKAYVSSNEEAKSVVSNYLSNKLGIRPDIILNAISCVSNKPNCSDGEEIYIVHKKTKRNKDKLLYVYFAYWLIV